MDVTVIAASHNVGPEILKVLRALDAQDFESPFEFIVVDDCSSDDTFQLVTSFVPSRYELRAYRLPQQGGAGGARNLALEVSRGDLIIFIGDDTVPVRSFVRSHVEIHNRKMDAMTAVLGRIEWPSDLPVNTLMRHVAGIGAQQFSYYYLKPGEEYDYRHFYTSNVSMRRDLLDKEKKAKGWFRERMFSFEDIELSYRLAKRGLKIYYHPEPLVEHYHYHNIWTFSRRQWTAGFWAWGVIRTHPNTATLIARPLTWTRKILHGYRKVRSLGSPIDAITYEQAVLRFVSFYEWIDTTLVDLLYFPVLEYFYVKGLVDSLISSQSARHRIYQALQFAMLVPTLDCFVSQAKTNKVALPPGYEDLLRFQPFNRKSRKSRA